MALHPDLSGRVALVTGGGRHVLYLFSVHPIILSSRSFPACLP
jgi:hypothetical protein